MNENEIEEEIVEKGLNAPRLTPDLINDTIKEAYYHIVPNTSLTICVLTLHNGFHVTGESAAASIENFDKELGEEIAYANARDKIWTLEGYLLKQKIFDRSIVVDSRR